MKKIISLIIFSIIFKGYISEPEAEKVSCSEVKEDLENTCETAVTSNPKTKCIFETGKTACSEVEKTCTEITEGASEEICASVKVTGDNACVYKDKVCKTATLCKKVQNPSVDTDCSNAPTSDQVSLKCILKNESGTKSCVEEAKKCSEILFGGTDTICSKASVSETKYKCTAESGKCKEVEEAAASSKNTTKSSTKADEKNGANYMKLSFGLLGLLFF